VSNFHVFCSKTSFRRYRGRWFPFLRFALSNSFWAVPRAPGSVFMFCTPRPIFDVKRAYGPYFMFCAHVLILVSTEGSRSSFHVLCSQTHFGRYRGHRVLFLCFSLPISFSTVPRAPSPVFKFFVIGHVFGGTEGTRFSFHDFHS
jgi:hypothetical protein